MQFSNHLILGQYIPGKTALHTLNPSCKIVALFFLLVGIFVTSHPLSFFYWGAILLLLTKWGQIPWVTVRRSVKPILFLLFFTATLHIFTTPGHVLYAWGSITVTLDGFLRAWIIGSRMLLLVLYSSLLMMVTTPMAFSSGLERILSPLKRLGIPSEEIAMMMTLALRFLPTFSEEAERIIKAQLSRGADLEQKGVMKRLKSFIPILIPLFVQVFQRADNLAVAMEARCYRCGTARTRLHPLSWSRGENRALLFTLLSALIALGLFRWAL